MLSLFPFTSYPPQVCVASHSRVCAQLCRGHRAEGRGRAGGAVQAGAAVRLGADQAGQLSEEDGTHHQDLADAHLP